MVYVGLDVHRKRTQVAIMDDSGKQIANRNVTNDPGQLMPLLAALEPGTPVAFESAYGWGWVAELLDDLGLKPHLAHARNCKAIASARLKNDKVDAATLAHLLRTDLLAEAHIASQEVRDLRRTLRHRVTLVRFSTRLKNRVHAVLADDGVALPGPLWTKPGREWLADLDLPDAKRAVVNDCTSLIDDLAAITASLEKDIRAAAKQDRRVAALKTIHGVGDITAMTLVAEIDDVFRFPSPRKLCAWAGLTPTVRNSDIKVRHGHISKQGSVWVRWVMIEAAHIAKTKPPFAAPFATIAHRRGKKIATVAVARKLLTKCYFVLKHASDSAQQTNTREVSAPGELEATMA
jgi:transposase